MPGISAHRVCAPMGMAGFTSAASQRRVLKCAANPARCPFLSQCQPMAALPRLGLTCTLFTAAGPGRFLAPARYKTVASIAGIRGCVGRWGRYRTAHPGLSNTCKSVMKPQVLCCSRFPTHVTLPTYGLSPRMGGRNR